MPGQKRTMNKAKTLSSIWCSPAANAAQLVHNAYDAFQATAMASISTNQLCLLDVNGITNTDESEQPN